MPFENSLQTLRRDFARHRIAIPLVPVLPIETSGHQSKTKTRRPVRDIWPWLEKDRKFKSHFQFNLAPQHRLLARQKDETMAQIGAAGKTAGLSEFAFYVRTFPAHSKRTTPHRVDRGVASARRSRREIPHLSFALSQCLVIASDPLLIASHSADPHFPDRTSEARRAGDVADGDLCVVLLDGSLRRSFTY